MIKAPLALAALALALPATAGAAYAPKLSVKIDPLTPLTHPAITSTITQASGEEASKTVKLVFPVGFAPDISRISRTPVCTPAEQAARACPANTKLGTARATTMLPGEFTGTVHFGGFNPDASTKIIVFISNGVPLLDQTIVGKVSLIPTGGIETLFDGLPDVLTTSFTLSLEGGSTGLVLNPPDCGTYTLSADFTSQKGSKGKASAPVDIVGCPNTPPVVTSIALSRLGRSTAVGFTLSEPARVRILIRKLGRRTSLVRNYSAQAGRSRRSLGRRLARGRYRVTLRATDSEGGVKTRAVTLSVR